VDYIVHIVVLISVYATLAISLDVLVGHAGILSVAHAGYFGLGAYTVALVSTKLGITSVAVLLLAAVLGAITSLIVSIPALRLREDYFVIATFGFQIIFSSVLNNWMSVTRGPLGIPGIPEPTILALQVRSQAGFLALSGLVVAMSFVLVYALLPSAFGRVLHGIREDEVLVESLGKSVLRFKILTFALSASMAAVAGGVYAQYVSFVDPTSFTIMDSILIISMVIIGGAGSLFGPALGAALLVSLPELLRFVGLPTSIAANVRQIVYGLVLVIVVAVRPSGIMGNYRVGR
jgi:branched-chain amino acid transport system permease protein